MDMFCLRSIYQVLKRTYEPNSDCAGRVKQIMNNLRTSPANAIMKANPCDLA